MFARKLQRLSVEAIMENNDPSNEKIQIFNVIKNTSKKHKFSSFDICPASEFFAFQLSVEGIWN